MLEILAHDTSLWLIFSFLAFLFICIKFGGKVIINGLDRKIAEIRKQQEAEKEAEQIIAHAKAQAESMMKNAESDLAAMMTKKEEQLAERLHRMELNAIHSIQAKASDLAIEASREMIVRTMDEKLNQSLTDNTTKTLLKNLH